jgi:hypothetical protein
MANARPEATSADALRLVQRALDEFDSVPLEATLRRVVRIANLLGETFAAIRIGLELKASGGHPPANAEATRRLMADPDTWGKGGVAEDAVNEFMAERQRDDGLINTFSIAELEFFQAERFPAERLTAQQYENDLGHRKETIGVLARVRHHAFTYLCHWERQLTFAVTQGHALTVVSERVDKLSGTQAPDVLDKFNVAFRRLREAADRDSESEAAEEWSQALASCRRILKAVVDTVQPVDPSNTETVDGHRLTDDAYKNRLFEFLKLKVASKSRRAVLVRDGESLHERFDSTDTIASKGVHAGVAKDEAEFCALRTYVLCGEVLWLAEEA